MCYPYIGRTRRRPGTVGAGWRWELPGRRGLFELVLNYDQLWMSRTRHGPCTRATGIAPKVRRPAVHYRTLQVWGSAAGRAGASVQE